jgi:hypothetical protein
MLEGTQSVHGATVLVSALNHSRVYNGASEMAIRCGTSSIDWKSFCLGIKILQEELWLVKDELLQRDVARAGGVWCRCRGL